MSKPNSALTRLRRYLARHIEPRPDAGEAWCLNCSLNGGRTQVLGADSTRSHAREHGPAEHITITATWPSRKGTRHG